MKILVVGSGAREHAIVWKCGQSKLVDRLFCAPANAGIEKMAMRVDIAADDIECLVGFTRDCKVDLTIVGPEVPLVNGIVDRFEGEGLLILGPSKDAALIEGSKIFAKNVLQSCGLGDKTAPFKLFANPDAAKRHIQERGVPCVIKANGLFSGKGVVVARTVEQGIEAVDKLMAQDAGRLLLIEEYLEGRECSFTVLTDGWNILVFPVSRDYKQDLYGNNTGGMGAFSPVPDLSKEHYYEILGYIRRVLDALRAMGRPFKGFLYPGMMITDTGPKFLEFNCRLGDPEAQVVLPKLGSDFVELCYAAAYGNQNLAKNIWFNEDAFVNVVMASEGYPSNPKAAGKIYGLEDAAKEGALVFHAGKRGRVLSVVGRGETLDVAREIAYRAARHISFGNKNPKCGKQWFLENIAELRI